MPDPTNAERQRRWRQRRAAELPPMPICPACERRHTGARGLLCCRCWERLTEEGKAWKRERVRKARAKPTP